MQVESEYLGGMITNNYDRHGKANRQTLVFEKIHSYYHFCYQV